MHKVRVGEAMGLRGAIFIQGGYRFQVTYEGGAGGHSVVLTRLA